jgi:ubiquinone/menaquinone biosynthesis C-methylase UbiE
MTATSQRGFLRFMPWGRPDSMRALEQYRRGAAHYEQAAHIEATRRQIVARLGLKPGDAVLDVACGSGLNFSYLLEGIGPTGHLIGVELSPDMLGIATEKIERFGWSNLTLICASAEDATVPGPVDAVLISFAHDVMRSPRALENALAALKPGGRIVAAGPKWAPWWAIVTNLSIWRFTRRYITTFEGFERPWTILEKLAPDLEVEAILSGRGYLASGTRPGRAWEQSTEGGDHAL